MNQPHSPGTDYKMTPEQIEKLDRILLDWENEGGSKVFDFVEELLKARDTQHQEELQAAHRKGYRKGRIYENAHSCESKGEYFWVELEQDEEAAL